MKLANSRGGPWQRSPPIRTPQLLPSWGAIPSAFLHRSWKSRQLIAALATYLGQWCQPPPGSDHLLRHLGLSLQFNTINSALWEGGSPYMIKVNFTFLPVYIICTSSVNKISCWYNVCNTTRKKLEHQYFTVQWMVVVTATAGRTTFSGIWRLSMG